MVRHILVTIRHTWVCKTIDKLKRYTISYFLQYASYGRYKSHASAGQFKNIHTSVLKYEIIKYNHN